MVYLCVALLILGLEIWIKRRIRRNPALPRRICGGRLLLRRYDNYGFALGRLKQHPKTTRAIVSLVLIGFIAYSLPWLWGETVSPLLGLGLGFIYGGGSSNLLDRYIHGYVVDYFSFPLARWKAFRCLVFNLGDFSIFLGVLLLALYLLIHW